VADQTTSDNYRDLLPELNSGNVRLLDNKRLSSQLRNLERKVAPGSKDKITHPRDQHDDVACAVAGALLMAKPAVVQQPQIWGAISVAAPTSEDVMFERVNPALW
jgi:hypothetical protein